MSPFPVPRFAPPSAPGREPRPWCAVCAPFCNGERAGTSEFRPALVNYRGVPMCDGHAIQHAWSRFGVEHTIAMLQAIEDRDGQPLSRAQVHQLLEVGAT